MPAPQDLVLWSELVAAPRAAASFQAVGKVHFESRDEEIDGDLTVRLVPPDRIWVQVHTKAMFGLVGERLTVLLPGDGFLLYHRERDDRLERWPFAGSAAADLSPSGTPADLLALATASLGGLPWLQGKDLQNRLRVRLEGGERTFLVPAPGDSGAGTLQVWLRGADPARVEWRTEEGRVLDVRYERFEDVGTSRVPSRIEVHAPRAGIRATVRLDTIDPRPGFAPSEFEIGLRNPTRPGGVHGG